MQLPFASADQPPEGIAVTEGDGVHIGRAQVPSLADLYSVRLQVIGYWSFLGGLLTTLVAMEFSNLVAVRGGVGLLAASLAVFGFNVAKMLRHFIQPQLKPLAKIPALRPAL